MSPLSFARVVSALLVALLTLGIPAWVVLAASSAAHTARAPQTLEETGLFADSSTLRIADDVLAYSPQYPLWTDGALKQRWMRLPEGAAIDASDVDTWRFPVGTQFWKQFGFERRVETRYMQLGPDGRWIYATYAWNEDESAAELAPERGVRGACESVDGARHDIPSVFDCRACHEGTPTSVLGFSALQLSSVRDPLAPHADAISANDVDLAALAQRGWIRNLPQEWLEHAPTIAAPSPTARAALGYMHANCASCHNPRGPLAELALDLEYSLVRGSSAERTTSGVLSRFQIAGLPEGRRITPGDPEHSVLFRRIATRNPLVQMPAIGTHVVDASAVSLLRAWIADDLRTSRVALGADANDLQR